MNITTYNDSNSCDINVLHHLSIFPTDLYRVWRQAGLFFFYVFLFALGQYSFNVKNNNNNNWCNFVIIPKIKLQPSFIMTANLFI